MATPSGTAANPEARFFASLCSGLFPKAKSDRYPSIVRAAAKLKCQSAIIDGEAIVQDGNGASDFEALRSAMRWKPQSIILYAFDLLHLDGTDLRQQTLLERRAHLKALIGNHADNRIQFSDEFDGDGHALFKACAERTLEGIVSKHALAPSQLDLFFPQVDSSSPKAAANTMALVLLRTAPFA